MRASNNTQHEEAGQKKEQRGAKRPRTGTVDESRRKSDKRGKETPGTEGPKTTAAGDAHRRGTKHGNEPRDDEGSRTKDLHVGRHEKPNDDRRSTRVKVNTSATKYRGYD